MEGQPKRIIKHAIIDEGIGPISAGELLSTPTVRWELWRRMAAFGRSLPGAPRPI
jgi:hypothetical protein